MLTTGSQGRSPPVCARRVRPHAPPVRRGSPIAGRPGYVPCSATAYGRAQCAPACHARRGTDATSHWAPTPRAPGRKAARPPRRTGSGGSVRAMRYSICGYAPRADRRTCPNGCGTWAGARRTWECGCLCRGDYGKREYSMELQPWFHCMTCHWH